MAKHINIPIFIPHEGCPNNCVFCNQHTITGVTKTADRDIKSEIETALSTYKGTAKDAEIAFFGGSFTGIDRSLMIDLLSTAHAFVKSGQVSSIRLSTRPDYIDEEILDILLSYGVTDIELGLQSMADNVLKAAKRGHTAETAEKACKLIKEHGFTLAGQMMIGLPESTLEDEIYTAEKIVEMGCHGARIYPTVVFEDTELCQMAKSGIYSPISVEDAVVRGSEVYSVFARAGTNILRIGLQSTEALTSGENVYGGANHSALGELIVGEYYYKLMTENIENIVKKAAGKEIILEIICAAGEQSKTAGQKKKNKVRLTEQLKNRGVRLKDIKITQSENLSKNNLEFIVHIQK